MTFRIVRNLSWTATAGGIVFACASPIGDDVFLGESGPQPSFVAPPDASSEAASTSRELTEYCASNNCPVGFTSCPNSKFLCDVDLRSDRNNCGACGVACPQDSSKEEYNCIGGQCVMKCIERTYNADCDGIVDNGCEVPLKTNGNCAACGDKCAENAPCVDVDSTPQCGCPFPLTYCKPARPSAKPCVDLTKDSANCGACGITCAPAGPPGAPPRPPNTLYGCVSGQCNKLKCEEGYSDCNGDLNEPDSDGCEVALSSNENCTQCGDNCTARGAICGMDLRSGVLRAMCLCAPGQTFCPVDGYVGGNGSTMVPIGVCADFTSDPDNCGACGRACPGLTARSRGNCEYGVCTRHCNARWADCNGNVDDDCEVDIFSDPLNCGGCGITCAAGQACAGGRCVVEPCSGEVAR
jgi:hypothetical protein